MNQVVMHTAGQSEAGLTQIGELQAELSQLQSLNAKMEEDLLAAERTGRHSAAGNGQDPQDESEPGFNGGHCSPVSPILNVSCFTFVLILKCYCDIFSQ